MEEQRKMKPLQKKDFGKTSKGKLATVYTLENEAGMQISVSDFGATLTSVLVPDKDNNPVEVTLGYDDATGYEAGLGNAFGASVGRNANRIGGAVIEINGTEYHLTKNDGENNLHSGLDFYHGRMWKVADADDTHVTFEMDSPDGDQGYPGTLDMHVTYELTEDNELNAEIAKEILTSAGMMVDWVEDGSACLNRLRQVEVGYYQVILMDIQMPKMNGYEATKRIRELPVSGMAHIPIIAMTANAFSDDQKRALDVGMNGFITKPIDVDRMLRTIQQTLQR